MKFRAGELEFNASVVEANQSPSSQTGDPLQSLTIQFRAQKAEMHEQALLEAQLRQDGGVFSLGEGDESEMEWRVLESRSTFVGTEPWGVNHHIWRLEQVERLACERLLIGPIELEPYDYAEEAGADGVVRLAARALISEADLERLSQMADVVPVARVGISDTVRTMSLAYVWGERAEGLAVVLRFEDAGEPRITLASADPAGDELGDLIALLGSKGILDDADRAHLIRSRHVRRYVKNIDAWPLQT